MKDDTSREAESYSRTISWLRALPPRAVVPWNDDGGVDPWFRTWVDVIVLELMAAVPMGWVWTIVPPERQLGSAEVWWELSVPYDIDVWVLESKDGIEMATALTPLDAHDALGVDAATDPTSLTWRQTSGWSSTAVSAALARWTATHAGREDITFHWDPDVVGPMTMELMERETRQVAGIDEPSYLIGQTSGGQDIVVAEQAMDTLLSVDPEQAALITRALRNLPSGGVDGAT